VVGDPANFIPFTWALSRLVHVGFLIAGTLPFVTGAVVWQARHRHRESRALIVSGVITAGVLFALMAYIIVFLCVTTGQLPQSVFPQARLVHRPYDLVALFLYLFAGSVVFPRFYRAQPSLFSHALLVSVIPNVAAELYAAFGSVALYDNNFNIAAFHKIVAYLVPFMGLLLDYRLAYHADVALQVTQEKLRVARDVQQGLLPHEAPGVPGYDVAGSYQPADVVGGDYFDYLRMADGRLGLVVADVSGHEIGASLLMAKTRAYLRAVVQGDDDLATMLGRLHRFLVEDVKDKWFVTLFFGALDPQTATIEYAGAGQQAHIVRADGSLTVLTSTSTPLGVFADHPPRLGEPATLGPGDVLIAVTDGIVEARNAAGEQFGQERLVATVRMESGRSSRQTIDSVMSAVQAFCKPLVPEDDLTVVVVRKVETGQA
jgi:hypothetical protein